MPNVIAVFNHKGGVGKSCTAVNLGAYLVQECGGRSLILDLDPQANSTRALVGTEVTDNALTISDALRGTHELAASILPTKLDGLDVAVADIHLSEVEFNLLSVPDREHLLKKALRTIAPSYDYIIIDCPPSMGILSLNGLAAANHVLICCETQFLAIRGMRYVLDIVELVRQKLNPSLQVLGVLATKFYVLSKANHEALAYLKNLKGVRTFEAVIPRDVKAEEAPSHGVPLALYAPDSRAAQRYKALAKEVNELCRTN